MTEATAQALQKVGESNGWKYESSDDCTKLARTVQTWRGLAVCSKHEQQRSEKLGCRRLTTVEWSSTWATCGMSSAVFCTIWSHFHDHGQCWRRSSCSPCTRILRRCALHSCRCRCYWCTDRCLGRTWWTSFCCCSQAHHCDRCRCPSSQTLTARSCVTRRVQKICCIRPRTSCCHASAAQISVCSDRSVSVDWACRCQSSSCLWCPETRL